ncbi:MAG: SCP2 sterol-binding domain-containing protein [Candidatus Dormibacteraeota bacterium]|nr:SCP2 sterol-binding domain-containing protein [Candidatus Dormibacteraeota bacterium]
MSAADLANVVGDKSDEELSQLIKDLQGDEAIIKVIFDRMPDRFLADKAAGRNAVIQYDINLPEGTESWQVVVADGTCTTNKGADKEAAVTLTTSGPDFLRIISGKLNGVQAFMSGKLKLKGDMMLAQSMQTWFDQT